MNRTYWNRMAARYETEIFSVLKHDRAGLIAEKARRFGDKKQTASDIGCGPGYFLPMLSRLFRKVHAVDISSRNIAKARAAGARLPNVDYQTADLAAPGVRLPRADFALCVNAAIAPSLAHRNRMLDVTCRHLRPGGHLVLVVPSLESAFLTDFRLIECNLRNGMRPGSAVRSGFGANPKAGRVRVHEGVLRIDKVETKHYLQEELLILLQSRGMRTLEIEKIEYPWTTEFTHAPRWMRSPFPWDWLVVARKT
jgi:SAM-dependent methyltransferase